MPLMTELWTNEFKHVVEFSFLNFKLICFLIVYVNDMDKLYAMPSIVLL